MAAVTHCMSYWSLGVSTEEFRFSITIMLLWWSQPRVHEVSHAVAILMCLNVANLQFECVHVYVPRFLATCAISKLRCANWRLPNCVPISKLRTQFRNCATRTSAQIRNDSLYSIETMVASSKHFFMHLLQQVKNVNALRRSVMPRRLRHTTVTIVSKKYLSSHAILVRSILMLARLLL